MMEDLRFYDFGLNLLDVENKFISSNWNIYFNDIGKVEVHLPYTSKSLPVIFDNKYLILVQGEKQALITGKQVGDDCVIYGRTPNWILSKRVLLPFEAHGEETDVEAFLREKALSAFSDCDNFVLGDICSLGYMADLSLTNPVSLFDFVKDTLTADEAGHKVYFDIPEKKWVFEVLKGERRNVIISESSLTSYDTEYVFDIQDYFNSGIFKQKESQEEEAVYGKISNEELCGFYKWETILDSDNKTDAESELSKKKISVKYLPLFVIYKCTTIH